MEDEAIFRVLRKVYARLAATDVLWALTGSLAHAIQGVPVEPHDIDIMTDQISAYDMERLFVGSVVRPVVFSEAEIIRSHFGALLIDGVQIEIMGDLQKRLEDGAWETPIDILSHRRFVVCEDLRVPVLPLEYEYQAYVKLRRPERAAVLRSWLDAYSVPLPESRPSS